MPVEAVAVCLFERQSDTGNNAALRPFFGATFGRPTL